MAVTVVVLCAAAAHPASAVTILATSATVGNPGDRGQICVSLDTGGKEVAGTQNDLRWDNNCASMPVGAGNKPDCHVMGAHGKDLHADFPPGNEFYVRALLLSFGNTDPMPDGPLYCCNFESEAEPGQCCTINITNVGSSDPKGGALPTSAGPAARICTMSSGGGQGIGSIDSGMNTNQPLSASNAPVGGGGANVPAPAAPAPVGAPAAGGGGAVNQVLPGGGARVENPTPAIAVPAAPITLPTPAAPAAPQVAQAKPPAAPAAPAVAPPATTAAAAHPTSAPTTPAAMDTPTVKVIPPTAPPTKAAPAALEQKAKPAANAANAPKAEQSSGWFGCQITAGASATPLLGLGVLAVIGAGWQRRRRSRRNSRPQR